MNDIKTPDDEPTNNNFNEEFDFGEAETSIRTTKTQASPQINKKVLALSILVAIAIVVVMGYRFYRSNVAQLKKEQNSTSTTTSVIKTPTADKLPPAPPVAALNSSETNFTGIAEAFNAADHTTPATHAHAPNVPTKDTNIQNLQKELFANDNAHKQATPTSASAPLSGSAEVPHAVSIDAKTLELSQGLNKLTQQVSEIFEQIKYLDSYTRDISENLNKLNESISTLDSRLSVLTNTTSTLSKDVGTVRTDVGHFKKVLKEDGLYINDDTLENQASPQKTTMPVEKIRMEEPEYRVHAVIPGRAWLKSSKGQIITVAEGDTIGNYGKILVIDAANGVVLTSSGVAFR